MSAPNRLTTAAPDGTVLFIVGMRINRLWALNKVLPVLLAMPRMLVEQIRNPDLGMIGKPRTFLSGRLVVVVQYWRDYESLERYALKPELSHLKAWRAFNASARGNSAVGVFHETYVLGAGNHETVYVNVPAEILLAAAVGAVPATGARESSRGRIGK